LVLVHLLVDPGNLRLSTPIMMAFQVIRKTSRTYFPFYTIASHFTMIAGILRFSYSRLQHQGDPTHASF
jgi:hypothetical protein